MQSNGAQAADFIRCRNRFLIFAHVKPDGDAIGSLFGLAHALRKLGKEAVAVLPDEIPLKYRALLRDEPFLPNVPEDRRFDGWITLDCSRADRIAGGAGFSLANAPCPVLHIDHHADDDVQTCCTLIDGNAAATALLIAELLADFPDAWDAKTATFLYLGLATDTGCFRFGNTDVRAFSCATQLRAAGADHNAIVNAAFFSKSANQQKFEAELILHCEKSACSGKLLYAVIPQELLDRYHFDMRDGESVIELLREIDTTVVAVLIYPRDGGWKLSFRSKDPQISVGKIARLFGGGGHELAAGATVCSMELDSLIAKMTEEVEKVL